MNFFQVIGVWIAVIALLFLIQLVWAYFTGRKDGDNPFNVLMAIILTVIIIALLVGVYKYVYGHLNY